MKRRGNMPSASDPAQLLTNENIIVVSMCEPMKHMCKTKLLQCERMTTQTTKSPGGTSYINLTVQPSV